MHGGTAACAPRGVEFIRGEVGDRRPPTSARGRRAVVHLAAAVGVGQSMYEIARYVTSTRSRPPRSSSVLVGEPPDLARLVVASSMSIYGEGAYECADPRRRRAPPRPRRSSGPHWESLPERAGRVHARSRRRSRSRSIPTTSTR